MASVIGSQTRIFLLASLVSFSLFWVDALQAQEVAPLPNYVVAQFGEPPAVPEGPLSEELQSAVQIAFVDSMDHAAWRSEQMLALDVISESKDPRLVWIISDLMRFVSSHELNALLGSVAAELLGKDLQNRNQWGAR